MNGPLYTEPESEVHRRQDKRLMEKLGQRLTHVDQHIRQVEKRMEATEEMLEKSAAEMDERLRQAEEVITRDTDGLEEGRMPRGDVDGHSQKTRFGRTIKPPQKYCTENEGSLFAVKVFKGVGIQYIPWSFMDMTRLTSQLPDICQGGQKWITKFEEKTTGHLLAVGDIKDILTQVAGKSNAAEILANAGLRNVMDSEKADHIAFVTHRNQVWDVIQDAYPTKMDPGKLEAMMLG